jgi:repressor LexA
MNLTDRIRSIAAEEGHTFASIERSLSFGQGTIRKWDKSSPSCDKLLRVANLLSVSTDYLLTGIETSSNVPESNLLSLEAVEVAREWLKLDERGKAIIKGEILKRVEWLEHAKARGDTEASSELAPIPTATTQIPMLGRAAAGTPIEMIVTYDAFDINTDTATRPGDFAVQAVGDSMIDADIRDGDLCIIRPQPTVENGEIALVSVDDGSTIKRFYKDDDSVRLVPCNPSHRTQLYDSHTEIRVLGKFIRTV